MTLFVSRNEALGIVQRTRKNLDYIMAASNGCERDEVHVVTHLVNSLLGLVVLPWEKELVTLSNYLKLARLHRRRYQIRAQAN